MELAITVGTVVLGAVVAKKVTIRPSLTDITVKDCNVKPIIEKGLTAPVLPAGYVLDYWTQGGYLTANTTDIPTDKLMEVCESLMKQMSATATGTDAFVTMGIKCD